MIFPRTIAFSAVTLVLAPSVAQAHLGHIGEVAGHSHWLGLGALVAAAAAIALLPKKKKADESDETPQEETSGEVAGEEETA